jgi:hypothetical protein
MPGIFAWYYGGRLVNGLVSGGTLAAAGRHPLSHPRRRAARGRGCGGCAGARRAVGGAQWGTSRGGFGATGARGSYGG